MVKDRVKQRRIGVSQLRIDPGDDSYVGWMHGFKGLPVDPHPTTNWGALFDGEAGL